MCFLPELTEEQKREYAKIVRTSYKERIDEIAVELVNTLAETVLQLQPDTKIEIIRGKDDFTARIIDSTGNVCSGIVIGEHCTESSLHPLFTLAELNKATVLTAVYDLTKGGAKNMQERLERAEKELSDVSDALKTHCRPDVDVKEHPLYKQHLRHVESIKERMPEKK